MVKFSWSGWSKVDNKVQSVQSPIKPSLLQLTRSWYSKRRIRFPHGFFTHIFVMIMLVPLSASIRVKYENYHKGQKTNK